MFIVSHTSSFNKRYFSTMITFPQDVEDSRGSSRKSAVDSASNGSSNGSSGGGGGGGSGSGSDNSPPPSPHRILASAEGHKGEEDAPPPPPMFQRTTSGKMSRSSCGLVDGSEGLVNMAPSEISEGRGRGL